MRQLGISLQKLAIVGSTAPLLLMAMVAPTWAAGKLTGPAGDYNVFVLEDITQKGGDFWGKVAVGGNATFEGVGIADRETNSDGATDNLIVGGNLTKTNGQVFGGNAVVGGTVTNPVSFNCQNCKVKPGMPIDFAKAKTTYTDLSAQLGGLAINGTSNLTPWGQLQLESNSVDRAVFSVSLKDAKELSLKTPSTTSLVVINVTDEVVDLKSFGNFLNNGSNSATDWTKVIWNFPNAKTLDLSGLSWKGTILAPKAELKLANGNIEGQVIVRSATLGSGSGEFHNFPFIGQLPDVSVTPDPTPTPEDPTPRSVPEPSIVGAMALLAGAAMLKRGKIAQ